MTHTDTARRWASPRAGAADLRDRQPAAAVHRFRVGRRWRASVVVLSWLGGLLLLPASRAGAYTTQSPRSDLHGAAAGCSWGAYVYPYAWNPWFDYTYVYNQGKVEQQPDVFCGQEVAYVRGQRKVCGAFGCEWQTKNEVPGRPISTYWSATAKQDCIDGTHRYRTRTSYYYRTMSNLSVSQLLADDSDVEPEYTCSSGGK